MRPHLKRVRWLRRRKGRPLINGGPVERPLSS